MPRGIEIGLEGLPLASEPVAPDRAVEEAEGPLVGSPVDHGRGQQDQAGARPQHRKASLRRRPHGLEESRGLEHERQGGGFAARQHQAGYSVQVVGPAHPRPVGPHSGQSRQMLADVPLQAQNTDP